MMVDSVVQRDPVERLAEEFASRCRGGESPSVAHYVERYPQYADQFRGHELASFFLPMASSTMSFRYSKHIARQPSTRKNTKG